MIGPFRFFSYDILAGAIVDEVDFTTFRFNNARNVPGGFSASIPTSDPKCDPSVLLEGKHAILVDDDGVLRFGGIIWEKRFDKDLTTMTVGGEGFWSFFRDGRSPHLGPQPLVFTDDDQFNIVTFCLATCQADAPVKNIGLQTRLHGPGPGGLSNVVRTREIKASELKDYGAIVEDLADADDGFDFAVTTEWNAGAPALWLDLWPKRGTRRNIIWEVGSNVALMSDWADEMGANRVHAVGASDGGEPPVRTSVRTTEGRLRIDKVVSYSDVKDVRHLLANARGELAREKIGLGDLKVRVLDNVDLGLSTWDIGDTVPVIANRHYDNFAAVYRITGYEVDIAKDARGGGSLAVTVDLAEPSDITLITEPTPPPPIRATLVSIDVLPVGGLVLVGQSANYRAVGHYSNGSTQDITNAVTWTSSDTAIATIGDTPGTKGRVTGLAAGGVGIRATDNETGLYGGTIVAIESVTETAGFIGGVQFAYTGGSNADLDAIRAMTDKEHWLRVTIDIGTFAGAGNISSPLAGADYTLGGYRSFIEHAHSIGLKVLGLLTYSPSYMRNSAEKQIPQTTQQRNAWITAAAAIVQSLGDNLDAIELWNEPNHGPFNQAPDMATIRPFMRDSILYLRAVAPTKPIMCGGPASAASRVGQWNAKWDTGTTAGGGSISMATYLDGLYGAGGIVAGSTSGQPYVDAIAVHAYTGNYRQFGLAGVDHQAFENPPYHTFRDMPNVGDPAVFGSAGFNFYDDIVVARGDGAKRIWATEQGFFGGFPGPPLAYTEAEARDDMQIVLSMWRANQIAGKAGPYIYFQYRDTDTGTGSASETYLGLRTAANATKLQHAKWLEFLNG